jgi:hypothetical protein
MVIGSYAATSWLPFTSNFVGLEDGFRVGEAVANGDKVVLKPSPGKVQVCEVKGIHPPVQFSDVVQEVCCAAKISPHSPSCLGTAYPNVSVFDNKIEPCSK